MTKEKTTPTLAAALVKAQKQFNPALKNTNNAFFNNKYADLAACIEAVIDALNDNGIMLMQPTHECERGVLVETLFIHESGEQFSAGRLHVPATKPDAQGYGSALTYARRYSLMAACGIAPEDDDGNAAAKFNPQAYKQTLANIAAATDMPSLTALYKEAVAAYPQKENELKTAAGERRKTLEQPVTPEGATA